MNVNPFSYLIEKLKGKVDKSGDTMTGQLNINNSSDTPLILKKTNSSIGKVYLGFANSAETIGYFSVGADKNPYFASGNGTDKQIALTSDIGNLKFYVTTLSDTIPANQNTASGVSISDLTSGILTDSSRIKGISFFNGYPSFYMLLWYNNKVVLGDPSGVSASARTVNLPIVIMYQ